MIPLFAATGPHISLQADTLFHLGPLPITNSMILGVFGYGIVIWMMFYVARKIRSGQTNRFVVAIHWVFEMLLQTVEQVTGNRDLARRLAPLAITIFFFVLTNYWLGIVPFVGPVTYNGLPLFRGLAADLNVTFALAIISMTVAQIYAIKVHGVFGNIGRYVRNPFKDPAGAFEGALEVIAEFARLVALSLRLFGNVFAGEVLIVVVGYMTSYFASVALLPFFVLELFIGTIQAYVFFMLTTVFVSLGVASHGHDVHSPSDEAKAEAHVLKPAVNET